MQDHFTTPARAADECSSPHYYFTVIVTSMYTPPPPPRPSTFSPLPAGTTTDTAAQLEHFLCYHSANLCIVFLARHGVLTTIFLARNFSLQVYTQSMADDACVELTKF
ncbi:unnamed protein product [Hydatigera taeniaeformis]|uniref:Uncharacterized protein n=1 Tax=Hydatigena taeniaeformis TaxID=6205 RepID=A0A0R3WP55_HYDTA|nr:unnamed protein product [Hydatigera taeniaeformis]